MTAARDALAHIDVDRVLPYVHAEGEDEVRDAFDRTLKARVLGPEAAELADRWFFETVVRVHRAGEGAAFTGLKPAGLDVGPVIPAAERALESGSTGDLVRVLCERLDEQVEKRHRHAMALKAHAGEGVEAARAYVGAMLDLQVWAHAVDRQVMAAPHAHLGAHQHD